MPMYPVREIAKYGIITDPDPYDLPTQAWSAGVNARFRNAKVTRGPVFRTAHVLSHTNPRFLATYNPTTAIDQLFIGYNTGRLFNYASGTETDYSIASYVDSVSEATWTACKLADVLWVNRSDRAPWYLRTSDSQFQKIAINAAPAGWDSTWTCQLLRSCGGALVALNVTKGASTFATMVKTSSFPTSGTIPASWDQTTPSTSATENILAEMSGPIIDAASFGNDLIIYGRQEAWRMTLNPGSAEIFDYVHLPFGEQYGAINANCAIEVSGLHFVFGPEDIWVHDGVTPRSLTTDAKGDGIVHDWIYTSINVSKFNRCFVAHNSRLKELYFCYICGDRLNAYPAATDGCNRQAVYNYEKKIWTFDDLPLAYYGLRSNVSNASTFDALPGAFDTLGGSFDDLQDGFKRNVFFVGDTSSTYSLTASLYGFDLFGPGSTLSFPIDTNATKNLYLERDGIDLDEIGADLRGYKLLNSIYPQGRLDANAQPMQFSFGSADYFNVAPTFLPYMTYDGSSLYKLDYNTAGRYLSMKLLFADYNYMSLSGFDMDIDVLAER